MVKCTSDKRLLVVRFYLGLFIIKYKKRGGVTATHETHDFVMLVRIQPPLYYLFLQIKTMFLFSPLESTYCNYFYVLSIFGFIFFVMAVINFLLRLINPAKKNNNMHLLYHFTLMVQTFLAYF